MKENLHPAITTTTILCACGNKIETYSTLVKDFNIEICSACHPLFTGKQRLVDSAGRIERFHKKYASHAAKNKGTAGSNSTTGR